MNTFIQLTITGLANGAILALAALGFVIVFKATGVINFAQGYFLLLGAYLVWAGIVQFGMPWYFALIVALAVAVLVGLATERFVLRPLVGENVISVIMVTIGLSFVLQGGIQFLWGTEPRPMPSFIPRGTVDVLGVPVSVNRIWAVVLAGSVLIALTLFFQRSRHGIAMRAVADDQQAAMTVGISIRRVFALAWALAATSAVLAGVIVANLFGVSGGVAAFGLLVFPVVILGGLDSVPGAIVAGGVIGLLVSYTSGYVGGGLQQVIPYVVLVLILLFRPYGLFGEVRIERV
ncbi:MAG TPA: branched-chain amino acid ABC transporter permease [Jiangellaceae bacterium]